MGDNEHICNQEGTLATICSDVKNIKDDVREIKENQATFISNLNSHEIRTAGYPTPETVDKVIARVNRHDTLFTVMWGILGALWSLFLVLLGLLLPKIMGWR